MLRINDQSNDRESTALEAGDKVITLVNHFNTGAEEKADAVKHEARDKYVQHYHAAQDSLYWIY
jgi:hypothetical protein